MTNHTNLQEKLRSIFFELITEVSKHSYDDLLSMLALRLNELLHTTNTAFYLYNNWHGTYELITKNNSVELKNVYSNTFTDNENHSNINGEQFYRNLSGQAASLIIPLHINHESIGLFHFSFEKCEDQFSENLVNVLKDDLEQFLEIVNKYRSSKEKNERNNFLLELTSRFYSSINKKDILTETTKSLRELYPNFKFYILLSGDYEAGSTLPIKEIEYSDDATKRVSTQAFMTGKVQLEDRIKEKCTCLYAPLRGNQGVYGVIQLITPQTMEFPKEEITFITRFALIAGKAIENERLYQHSKHLVTDLKLINEATHQLNSNLKISEITTIVRQQIMDACQATHVGFMYYREDSNQTYDVLPGSSDYFYTKQGNAFSKYILQQLNTDSDPIFSGDYSNDFPELPCRSVMAIPMLHTGTIHGAITIMHEEAYFFSFENFKLMQSLIQHLTLALTNAILNDKLEHAAITDYLTKLYSRKYLNEKIKQHMEIDEQGTLILVDIDDFKKINDTYGHHVGDEVIIQVADIIKFYLASDGIPARWGGEELAVYLPNASIDDGVHLASHIRRQAETFTDPMITLSCGVSTWSKKSMETVRDVFIRADKALYEAKSIGKNCVVKGNNMTSMVEKDIPN